MKDVRPAFVKAVSFSPLDSAGMTTLDAGQHRQLSEMQQVVVVDATGQMARSDAVKTTYSSTKSLRRFGKATAFRVGETVVIVDKAHVTNREKRALSRKALIRRLREKGSTADRGRTIDTTGMSDEEFIALLRR